MGDIQYAQVTYQKKRGNPQQNSPHLEDPDTIVYADIKKSKVKLPVENKIPDVKENIDIKYENISKILLAIIFALICVVVGLAYLAFSSFSGKDSVPSVNTTFTSNVTGFSEEPTVNPSTAYNNSVSVIDKCTEIKKKLCGQEQEPSGCQVCPNEWLRQRKSCYYFSPKTPSKTWNESLEMCGKMGARLLIIEDQEEKEFIDRSIKGQESESFWIGAYRDGDEWRWVDGRCYNTSLSPISGSQGNCISISAQDTGTYYIEDCQSNRSRICEKEALKI